MTMTATASLLVDLDDPSKFVREPEADLFDEHEVKDKDGRVIKRVTKADLEQYMAECNTRDLEGCPAAMTCGHTVDDEYDQAGKLVRRATEQEQPPIWGYFRHWKVAYSAQKKRHVLRATPFVMKEHAEEARKYPRASVEAWKTKKIIDPVAILKRTPERPMVWTHQAAGERYKPQDAHRGCYRYAMEPEAAASGGASDPLDPTAAPRADAPGPEEVKRFEMLAGACFPKLKEMHDKYAAACSAAPAMDAPAPGAAEPSKGKPMDDKEKHEMDELKKLVKVQGETNARLERGLVESARRRDLEKYQARGFQFDLEDELKDVVDLGPEKYAAHLKRIERYVKDPAAGEPLVNTSGPAGAGETADKFGMAQMEKANEYMEQNHAALQKLPFDERWQKARKFAMTGKDG
jgi:hypothetical protein